MKKLYSTGTFYEKSPQFEFCRRNNIPMKQNISFFWHATLEGENLTAFTLAFGDPIIVYQYERPKLIK